MRSLGRAWAGLILLVVWAAAPQASASLTVDRALIELDSGERTADIVVGNNGDKTLYILAEGARIDAPGTEVQTRVTDPDPRKVGLLVTPKKFILEAGKSRIVRAQVLAPASDVDQVFRLLIKPVTTGLDVEDRMGVEVVVAYDLLLIRRPPNPTPDLRVSRDAGRVVIRNAGNTNTFLTDGRQCRDFEFEDCDTLSGRRLYAGTSVSFAVDDTIQMLEFTYQVGEESRRLRWAP